MTLGEFIDALTKFRDGVLGSEDLPLYMSKDGEGNEFRPASSDVEMYDPEELSLEGVDTKVVAIWPAW